MPAYLRAGCHKHMKASTRLRLSNAPIAVNTQSYAIPYSDRVCSRCNSMALDNEQHLLFANTQLSVASAPVTLGVGLSTAAFLASAATSGN
jgi:hypothetical protein